MLALRVLNGAALSMLLPVLQSFIAEPWRTGRRPRLVPCMPCMIPGLRWTVCQGSVVAGAAFFVIVVLASCLTMCHPQDLSTSDDAGQICGKAGAPQPMAGIFAQHGVAHVQVYCAGTFGQVLACLMVVRASFLSSSLARRFQARSAVRCRGPHIRTPDLGCHGLEVMSCCGRYAESLGCKMLGAWKPALLLHSSH